MDADLNAKQGAGADRLARHFHEVYERLAPEFGYGKRSESVVEWEDVPEQNKALMRAVCAEVYPWVCVQLADVIRADVDHKRLADTEAERDTLRTERDRLSNGRWSNMTVGGKPLTWQEAAEHHEERARHEGFLAGVLADLDRCEHGRHEGDTCGSCGGHSHGNPHLQPVMGYDLSATPIVMPDNPRERRNPDAWYARATLDAK